ncbi:arylamine N-acetyltransferase family protein [Prauserella muralis]|uniref:Arylamine N-acetyltransferase n=1 Tax=Prauserella muralis TaxID=588067 RepID=A0A2V4ASG4_9PSEU|nr:arylamine N-acetyltransferase [Prauserella muralis]PXY22481.1 arylamine N-acetyltransferase [Prauserella muralis]TWE28158.1 N-hydroxyarylamine O-acetyltransferase [Prauserella muralis]
MTVTTPASQPQTDVWHVADLDLDAYLARIEQPHARPSAEALHALHEAHVRTIPFENIDPLLERSPVLELGAITGKLVHRRRGGYCYEHGLLFAAALERLGYRVTRCTARVQPHKSGPQTHMNLVVHADGTDFLADVGFGASVLYPMPLRDGAVVDQGGWPHRLLRDGRVWTLEKQTPQGWEPVHAFDETPQRPIDYEVFNHYVATHPHSPFTGRLVAFRLEPGRSRKLIGDQLVVERPDGSSDTTSVAPADLDATLRALDIELTPEELELARARYAGALNPEG